MFIELISPGEETDFVAARVYKIYFVAGTEGESLNSLCPGCVRLAALLRNL